MRVVIGEDETLLREGLRLVLEREGFEVVAAVADAEEVVAASARTSPDLVLTDLRMPPPGPTTGCARPRGSRHPARNRGGGAVPARQRSVRGRAAR